MSDSKKHFLLRLDEELYDALQKWAADELRSVNAQIEFLLQAAARQAGRLKAKGDGVTGRNGQPSVPRA